MGESVEAESPELLVLPDSLSESSIVHVRAVYSFGRNSSTQNEAEVNRSFRRAMYRALKALSLHWQYPIKINERRLVVLFESERESLLQKLRARRCAEALVETTSAE